MTRAEFAVAVRRMQTVEGARVTIKDFDGSSVGRPYRHASVQAEIPHAEAPLHAGKWLEIAVAIRGFFNVHTFSRECHFQIAVTLDLDVEPRVSGEPVSIETVIEEGAETFEARLDGDPFVWGRGATEREAIEDAKETLRDSGSKDIEMDLDRLVVTAVLR